MTAYGLLDYLWGKIYNILNKSINIRFTNYVLSLLHSDITSRYSLLGLDSLGHIPGETLARAAEDGVGGDEAECQPEHHQWLPCNHCKQQPELSLAVTLGATVNLKMRNKL